MAMEVDVPYGAGTRRITVPSGTRVLRSKTLPPLQDARVTCDAALRAPTESAPLLDLVSPTDRIALVVSDITRPTPNHLLVPWLLKALAKVPREQFVILVGNGSHRAMTHDELTSMLGEEVVATVPIINHDATDRAMLARLGTTSTGVPVWVNRHYLEADVRIVTGFIEPHFFAGFSGGPKGVVPGLAGLETIRALHSVELIDHPQSTWMELDENPIHQGIQAAVALCPPEFIVNVTLDPSHQITGIFAGHVVAAHRAGCSAILQQAIPVEKQCFDVVITSNAGYPLDQNLYQSVKGMTAAVQLVRAGGAIVLIAECRDGFPAHGAYQRLLTHAKTATELLETIHLPGFQSADQWQVQKQALVQQHAQVHLHSSLSEKSVTDALLIPAPHVQETINALLDMNGPQARVAVLPEGPMTVMQVQ
ncbi:MAG: nickel-dependent lactate racemase [Ktedonobacterales bacterium]